MMSMIATVHECRRQRLAEAGLARQEVTLVQIKPQERQTLHPCICDRCGSLVNGTRFKCLVCPDFDLCEGCLRKGCPVMKPCTAAEVHQESHELLLLPKAIPSSTVVQLCHAFRASTSEAEPGEEGLMVLCLCGDRKSCCGRCSGCPALWLPAGGTAAAARAKQMAAVWRRSERGKVEEPLQLDPQLETTETTELRRRPCRIRPMAAEDLEPVISLENICFMEPYSRDTFEAILEQQSYVTYVAETPAGRSAGYLTLELRGDSQGYVMSLAVLPVFRCRGVARQLLQHALWQAFQAGAQTVTLHVHTQNVGAIRLYRRCGFEILCEASDFYGSGDDLQRGNAYLMGCSLARPQDEAR